jgi:hypothetical protein
VSVDTRLRLDGATAGATGRRFRPHNTPERLRAFRAALFAAAALLGITSIVVLLGMHSNAVSVRDTSAPAYLDGVETQAVLTDADRAVWQSLRSGEAQLSGLGPQYEGDITIADQDLQQVAALEGSGSAGGQLQTVTGQLVTYQGLVEQADSAHRAHTAKPPPSGYDLGYAYLGYSGQTLFGQDGLLDTLSGLNQQSLNAELTSAWADPALIAALATAGVVVLVLIVALQLFLRRRFRRTISPPLLLAAVLVCGLLAWTFAVILPADSSLAKARSTALPGVVQIWRQQEETVFAQLVSLEQPGENAADAAGVLNLKAVQPARATLNADLLSAQTTGGLTIGTPIAIVVIAGLIFLAVKPRLDEYRGVDT